MPGFGLLFLINAFFIIHAARTGRFWPWAYVILLVPILGVAAYLLMEVLPDYRHAPPVRMAQSRVANAIAPERRYKVLKADLETADTIGARLTLAHECIGLKKYEEALGLYESIVASPQGDEPSYRIGKARAEFGLGRPEVALATLDELKRLWPAYQSQEGHLLYARALEACGRHKEALREYETLSRYFAGQEVQARRLVLLDRLGHVTEARAAAEAIVFYAKRCPRYARRQQAEWFSIAKSYLKSERVKSTG